MSIKHTLNLIYGHRISILYFFLYTQNTKDADRSIQGGKFNSITLCMWACIKLMITSFLFSFWEDSSLSLTRKWPRYVATLKFDTLFFFFFFKFLISLRYRLLLMRLTIMLNSNHVWKGFQFFWLFFLHI